MAVLEAEQKARRCIYIAYLCWRGTGLKGQMYEKVLHQKDQNYCSTEGKERIESFAQKL